MILRPHCLLRLINRGSFHGDELVHAYGTPDGDKPGLGDNVYHAEQALRDAESRGWITRGLYAPSRSQRFFGLSGFSGDRLDRLTEEHRSPVAHHWITKTTKYLTTGDV